MGSRVTTIQLKPIPYYRCLLASISSCFPSLISLLDYVPSAGGTGFVKLIGGLKSNPEISRSIFYGSIFLVAIVLSIFSILEVNLGSVQVLRIGVRSRRMRRVISQTRRVLDRCLQEHISSIIDRRKWRWFENELACKISSPRILPLERELCECFSKLLFSKLVVFEINLESFRKVLLWI